MRQLLHVLLLLAIGSPCTEAAEPVIRLVDFEDVAVTGATANRILGAIEEAERQGDDLILIELDTPGGYSEALQDIVKGMLGSKIPIVVWVGPSGSRAASAGFFIMLAADVATMAPGTRCGAASTIYSSGEGKEDDVLLKKANEDMAALLRSIAEHRGRNVEKAEAAVFAADAYSEIEALDEGLIELVAKDRDELLAQLFEQMDDHLGVGAGAETVAQLLQLLAQLGEVINLPVEHHRHRAVFIENRLGTASNIDDRQTPDSQGDLLPLQETLVVGTAVGHGPNHPAERRRVWRTGETANAAHLGG